MNDGMSVAGFAAGDGPADRKGDRLPGGRDVMALPPSRSGHFEKMMMSDGYPSLVWIPDTTDCICPAGLPGTDMCCRGHS